ncbi:MAG: UDP-N-acetylglucosamine 2-epimerase (non-hydrolyzing) [Clostridia bacterium]|nr:UDP-N-acetylglucosamine 2-epimerase (non-hydrolyzing) [Clostridia bacterium]
MVKVLIVFGTRPEAIKMAPLVLECKKNEQIDCRVCVTAQHRSMLDQVLNNFGFKPDYDLDIMEKNQTLSGITSKALIGIEKCIKDFEPDIVLVHGDTTTTFSGSLAAYYCQTKLGHVEAGLRTNNKYSPFPEELNRQLTGIIADYHFAPTQTAKENLLREGKNENDIIVTGNTVIDALKTTVKDDYNHPVLDWAKGSRLILLTSHRRENLGEPMQNIFRAVSRIVEEFEDVKVVFPMHLNPKIKVYADESLVKNNRIKIIEPLEALDFHNFIARSHLILTDSGGIQEEAPSLGKPVLVLRDTTERPEGIEAGTLLLAGTEEEQIYSLTKQLITDENMYKKMAETKNPYGDGLASQRIIKFIIERLTRQ